MGLDIRFNLAAAIAAGMAMSTERNGSDVEIQDAESDYAEEPTQVCSEYIAWLMENVNYGKISTFGLKFRVDISEEHAFVRANKWGHLL